MLRDRLATLDGAVSQFFTGNTCGLYCEVMGWRGNRIFRRARTVGSVELRARGAVSFSPRLTHAEVEALVGLLNAFERYRDSGYLATELEEWMLSSLVVKPNTVRFSGTPDLPNGLLADVAAKVQGQVERDLGLSVERLGVTLYRNRFTDDPATISGDWHFDRRPTDWMRAFVYLSDVTSTCGPLHFFDRETSAALCRRGFKRYSKTWQRRAEATNGFQRLLGPPGSGLLANAERILHRAGNPEKGQHRDMFELIFRPDPTD